ncbi:MAG: alpha/beta fold hydrolase [Flammeovirgaceae bacterium]|nr:alpha/beta fold hydrolase [Flammeovirgaceae bacterium]
MTKYTIPSRDGFPLSAVLFEAKHAISGCIQINSATGVKKEIYSNFATYLSEAGYHVVIFDYRGIGESRPKSLSGFHAHNHEWGQKDMAAVLDWLDDRFPSLPKFAVGHSAGGQQVGFMDNYHKFSKALAVSSSTGYWKYLASPYKYFTLFIWYGLEPIMNSTIGYLPASWFNLGEDLPKGVAKEWRAWCLNQNYYGDFLGKTIQQHYFHEVKMPTLFIYPEDDTIATDKSVEALRKFYSKAPTSVERLLLKDYHMKKIGHFGFFSRSSKERLWPKVISFFNDFEQPKTNN